MEIIDLSMETLMTACRGDVSALPSFMVHDNALWPDPNRIQLDNKNRIHCRRSTFLQTIAAKVPIREGLWHGLGVQEFHIDLQPHHMQGGEGAKGPEGHKHSRKIVKVDEYGRSPGDEDYGEVAVPGLDPREVERDRNAVRLETGDEVRGISVRIEPDGAEQAE